jgi:hypothetical protein
MESLAFKTAFKYPFNRAKGMWNILWVLLPIFGWFALGGYTIRIVREFINGNFGQLPLFQFKNDMKLGFFMLLKAIPFIVAYMAVIFVLMKISPWLRIVTTLFEIFAIPILGVHFINKGTVGSFFEFQIVKVVFQNLGDYVITILKGFLLGLVFIVMIIVLVGIPAGAFTKNIFLADFYRRKIKN